MAKSCVEQYRSMIKLMSVMAEICGANVIKANYKLGYYGFFILFAIFLFFCSVAYTICDGFIVRGDWKVILQGLSISGSGVQGLCKMLGAVSQRKVLISMNNKLDYIYDHYQHEKEFIPLLNYRINLCAKILKIVLSIYGLLVVSFTTIPIFYGIFFGQKLLVIQVLLPGVDPNTDSGYWIQISYQFFCFFLGSFGNFAGDMFLFTVSTHVPLFKDLIKFKAQKLNRQLESTNDSKKTKSLMKELINSHKDYIIYVEEIDTAFFAIICCQIVTSVMNICCTLFCIVIKSWPAAPVYLLYSFLLFYAYSALGNIVEVTNDEVLNVIYCDVLWYKLPVSEQKALLLMLRKSQKSTKLMIAGVTQLSMATALQLTKSIYGYFMMLMNFLE